MRSFAKNIFRVQTLSCDLTPLTVVTTDPTNQAGNDGTAIISYSGNQGSISYNINNGPFISVNMSPFTITGLQSSTEYTVIVKDDVEQNCQRSITFNLGESSFEFEADYIMLTYEFTDGKDLDTRTRIVTPDVGQNFQSQYLGWNVLPQYPEIGTPYSFWGGDNTQQGFESVLFNLIEFRNANPSATTLLIDARCFWFNGEEASVGVNPVNIAATLWKGGLPIKNGCNNGSNNFCWTNSTATDVFQINSVGKLITLLTNSATTSGERAATLTYDLINNTGVLNNNDTTTPFV